MVDRIEKKEPKWLAKQRQNGSLCNTGVSQVRSASHYGPRGEKPGTFSLHGKNPGVDVRSTYKKPNSIPVKFGHAAFHYQDIRDGYGHIVQKRCALRHSERHEFFKPTPLWPHMRTEKRIEGLKKAVRADGSLKFPVLIATLEKQAAAQKLDYDKVKADEQYTKPAE